MLRKSVPALAEAAGQVGDPAVRNRGTIGGNIAHADPASDLPTVLVALGAQIVAARRRGERTIPAEQFFTGIMTTALAEDEIVTAVDGAGERAGQGSAYVEVLAPGVAICGGRCGRAVVTRQDGKCTAARVAMGGLSSFATRAPAVEQAIIGTRGRRSRHASAAAACPQDLGDDVTGDIFASAEYRWRWRPCT